jgi:hypothetical protein
MDEERILNVSPRCLDRVDNDVIKPCPKCYTGVQKSQWALAFVQSRILSVKDRCFSLYEGISSLCDQMS